MSKAYNTTEMLFSALCRPRKIPLLPSHAGVTYRRSIEHEKDEIGGTIAPSSAAGLTH